MDPYCKVCKNKITSRDFTECSKCHHSFDLDCVNISVAEYKKLSEKDKIRWKCSECSAPRNDETPIRQALNDTYVSSGYVNMARGSKRTLTSTPQNESSLYEELQKIHHELRDLKSSNEEIKLLRNDILDLKLQMSSSLEEQRIKYEQKLKEKDTVIATLNEQLIETQNKFATQEQDLLKNDIEIIGVPEDPNENLHHILMMTAQKLGVELGDCEINDVTRVGSKRRFAGLESAGKNSNTANLSRPIVVKLVRKTKRDELIKAAKSRKNLDSGNLATGPAKPIYVNERLSSLNRNLFFLAKQRAKLLNIKFVWHRRGTVHIRQAEGKPAMAIKTLADLDAKMGPVLGTE